MHSCDPRHTPEAMEAREYGWERTKQLEQTIDALAGALRDVGIYLKNDDRYCWCGGGSSGGIAILHQDYCQQASAALAQAEGEK